MGLSSDQQGKPSIVSKLALALAIFFVFVAILLFTAANSENSNAVVGIIFIIIGILLSLPYIHSKKKSSLHTKGDVIMGLFNKKKTPTLAQIKTAAEEQRKREEYESGLISAGLSCEENGDTEGAINNYEKLIEIKFVGSHPYKRLAIIYREQKRYADEIRVINSYKNITPSHLYNSDQAKYKWFRDRLDKAEELTKE